MTEEVAIISGGDDGNLKATVATRTSQSDSGGGGEHAAPTMALPISTKQSGNPNNIMNKTRDRDSELSNKNRNKANAKLSCSDSEDGFLSTSPDSAHGDAATTMTTTSKTKIADICLCSNSENCVNLKNILDSFKAPLSEEQAWALIFQTVKLYRVAAGERLSSGGRVFSDFEIPDSLVNLNLHPDGTVHCSLGEAEKRAIGRHQAPNENLDEDMEERGEDNHAFVIASHKKILRKLGVIVYTALDYNLQADEQCQMSQELEELITYMTAEESDDDCIDEGIDEGYKRWDDENDDDKCNQTKELDYVLEACKNHVKPTVAEDHYKAVCRALVTESIELRIFLHHVLNDDTDNLRLKANSETSKQELAKLGFNDWARFWVQVIEELRRGVRLKKNEYSRAPIEYELTPYEILMEDIRSKKYQLRKVMVNGDIPPRVKKDAHALILEFIRSRPPLKKASERQLPPPIKRTPSPREQLMDSIRQGRTLKHIQPPPQPRLKDRLLPPTTTTTNAALTTTTIKTTAASPPASTATRHTLDSQQNKKLQQNFEAHTAPRSKQRLIKVDFSLLQDDDRFFDESFASTSNNSNTMSHHNSNIGVCSQPKMPPYPIGGYMVNAPTSTAAPSAQLPAALTTRVLRRTKDIYTEDEYHRFFDNALESYDLATQCESRRASLRRHTIVGCQSNFDETHSMPTSRPESRQSEVNTCVGRGEGVTAATATTTKPQQKYSSNIEQQQLPQNQLLQPQHQQLQQQQQLQRSQSPSGSSHSVEVGGSGSNCSRSSSSIGPWSKSFLDEKTWHERGDDRLSLTLEEIVHIRSVMTKAELEGLPVGVRVKEDVEKRKVCFLCLRTRFSIFGPWGIQCKLCQRTVCSKCYTKMRLPVENFRNVPLVLISPSLLASPAGSSTPSPSHHAHHAHSSSTGNILDETFPKSLIERLLRSESERKTRNTVGSAPSSPKHQRSNMSTPGIVAPSAAGQAVEALNDASMMTTSSTSSINNGAAVGVAGSSNAAAVSNGGCSNNNNNNKENAHLLNGTTTTATNKHISIMSRSVEGPRSLPVHSPARPHSNSSTLDRKSKFSRAFTLSPSPGPQLGSDGQKENVRGEIVPVCHDCKGLVMEITRSSKQTRSTARNRALQNLTLDLSPVYK